MIEKYEMKGVAAVSTAGIFAFSSIVQFLDRSHKAEAAEAMQESIKPQSVSQPIGELVLTPIINEITLPAAPVPNEPAPQLPTLPEDKTKSIDLGSFRSTCYSLRGKTYTGSQAGPGSIAVDDRVIPMGAQLEVEGYGAGKAVDTGGAIKGREIDVWMASSADCKEWGRRNVRVRMTEPPLN